MNRQVEILREVANRHGIGIGQAEEVWNLFGQTIGQTINKIEKNKDGIRDPDDFPIIHIDSFGKFIPRVSFIKRLNKLKLEKDGSKHNTTNE